MTIDKHRGIHRARRRAGNAIDSKPRFLKQTIEHAPRECAMRAATLQREIDENWIAIERHLGNPEPMWYASLIQDRSSEVLPFERHQQSLRREHSIPAGNAMSFWYLATQPDHFRKVVEHPDVGSMSDLPLSGRVADIPDRQVHQSGIAPL